MDDSPTYLDTYKRATRLCPEPQTKLETGASTSQTLEAELHSKSMGKVARRFKACGEDYALICEDCGDQKMTARRCELMFCEGCSRRRAAELSERWTKGAESHQEEHRTMKKGRPWCAPRLGWKLITLTLVVGPSLDEDWKRIGEAWKVFRRLLLSELVHAHRERLVERHGTSRGKARSKAAAYRKWAKSWVGGFSSREIGKGRNVHLHVMAFMPYVLQETITRLWQEATGDSYIVDVREIKGGIRGGTKEVAKYITKISEKSATEAIEIYEATRGTAHGRAWGAMHGKVESAQALKQSRVKPCENCGSFAWVPSDVFEMDNRRARAGPSIQLAS
tara:strand:+ start:15428 stop:16432 length:1005 start_codon:yes stop_codon:yes gene_type:complete